MDLIECDTTLSLISPIICFLLREVLRESLFTDCYCGVWVLFYFLHLFTFTSAPDCTNIWGVPMGGACMYMSETWSTSFFWLFPKFCVTVASHSAFKWHSNYCWIMIGLLRCMYTLVKLKSIRIGLLIVELRPLEYLIHSRVKRACTEWDWNMRSAHAWDLFPGPWARSRRRR